jgi:hypothetical protein
MNPESSTVGHALPTIASSA